MDNASSTTELAERLRSIGISGSYASQLANEKRTPSLDLAIEIYERLGVRLGRLKHANDEQVSVLADLVKTAGDA